MNGVRDHLDKRSSEAVLSCKKCQHWTRLPESDHYLPEDEIGSCTGLQSDRVEIEISAGWDGGNVDWVATQHDFFCANFSKRVEEGL